MLIGLLQGRNFELRRVSTLDDTNMRNTLGRNEIPKTYRTLKRRVITGRGSGDWKSRRQRASSATSARRLLRSVTAALYAVFGCW